MCHFTCYRVISTRQKCLCGHALTSPKASFGIHWNSVGHSHGSAIQPWELLGPNFLECRNLVDLFQRQSNLVQTIHQTVLPKWVNFKRKLFTIGSHNLKRIPMLACIEKITCDLAVHSDLIIAHLLVNEVDRDFGSRHCSICKEHFHLVARKSDR